MLDARVPCLEQPVACGLKLNAPNTKVLTTQAQSLSTLNTPAKSELDILERTKPHKCLGCLSSMVNIGTRQEDANDRLQSKFGAFQANRWMDTV